MSKLEKNVIVREFDVEKTVKTNVILTPVYDGRVHKYKQIKNC